MLCGNGLNPLGTQSASSMKAKVRISLPAACWGPYFLGGPVNAPGTWDSDAGTTETLDFLVLAFSGSLSRVGKLEGLKE